MIPIQHHSEQHSLNARVNQRNVSLLSVICHLFDCGFLLVFYFFHRNLLLDQLKVLIDIFLFFINGFSQVLNLGEKVRVCQFRTPLNFFQILQGFLARSVYNQLYWEFIVPMAMVPKINCFSSRDVLFFVDCLIMFFPRINSKGSDV